MTIISGVTRANARSVSMSAEMTRARAASRRGVERALHRREELLPPAEAGAIEVRPTGRSLAGRGDGEARAQDTRDVVGIARALPRVVGEEREHEVVDRGRHARVRAGR